MAIKSACYLLPIEMRTPAKEDLPVPDQPFEGLDLEDTEDLGGVGLEALVRIVSRVSEPACKTESYIQPDVKSYGTLFDCASVELESFPRNSHNELIKEILSFQSD